jgi:chloramphenicol O-acetyltransferase type A
MYSEIDLDQWPRRAAYDFFKGYADPFFNFSANLDVTAAYSYAKANGLRVSLVTLFCSLAAANSIPEFRTRWLDGRLVEFDRIHATQTILNPDETFSFCYFEMAGDVEAFDAAGRRSLDKYSALKTFDVESDRIDLIYYSVIPWVSFTSFKHASSLEPTQTVPRIVFGKIFQNGDSKMMPVSVEANHMIMDGIHVGKLFIRFQEQLDLLGQPE